MKRIFLMVIVFGFLQLLIAQTYNWKSVNLQGMGYITGIIDHPTEQNLVYTRTDVGGAYRFDYNTNAWQPITDGIENNIESIAIDASNPDNVYIAAHIYANSQSISLNCKIYKSINRGKSWKELKDFTSKNIFMDANGNYRGGGERLAVDPNNGGKTIYFGSRRDGLWKSNDAGATWNKITEVPSGTETGIIFVKFDETSGNANTNSQIIYAGIQGKGVYKSTDEGTTWGLLSGGPAINYLPIRSAIASNGTIYITYATGPYDGAAGAVYKYTGTGAMVNITPTIKSANGFWGVSVDLNNPSRVITAQWGIGDSQGIHLTTDGGQSWKELPFAYANRVEPEWYPTWAGWTYVAEIMFDATETKKAWITTGFAIYETEDVSVASPLWEAKMNNFEESVGKVVLCPPVDGGAALVTSILDMQGFVVQHPDTMPLHTFDGQFGIVQGIDYCVADPNVIAMTGSNEKGSNPSWIGNLPMYRYSQDNGKTWQNFTPPTSTSVNGNVAISSTDKNRWVIAPRNDSYIKNNVYYTTNMGTSWNIVTGLPAGEINGCTDQYAGNHFLAADQVNGSIFYYYTSTGGKVYRSIDGGQNFTLMNSGLPIADYAKIDAVPGKEGNLFFTAQKQLLYSNNGGATWIAIPNITECKTFGFGKAIAPSIEPTIYIAAIINQKFSVYRSVDFGKTWSDLVGNNSIPTIISDITGDLRDGTIVYAATGGRGIIYGKGEADFNNPAVTGISISEDTLAVLTRFTNQIKATIIPIDAKNKNIRWTSENESVAVVDTNGIVQGISSGNTRVSAITEDGSFVAKCIVKVGKPIAIKLFDSLQIDGNTDTLWNRSKSYRIINSIQGTISDTLDLSGSFKMMWDSTYLYLMADVVDDYDSPVMIGFNKCDGIQLSINSRNYALGNNDSVYFNYFFSRNNNVVLESDGKPTEGIFYEVSNKTDRYTAEIKLPFSTLGFEPKASDLIGLNIFLNDIDAITDSNKMLSWFSKSEQPVYNSDSLALVLLGIGTTGLSIGTDSLEVTIYKTEQLSAAIYPLDASEQGVEWFSADPSIASVDDSGLVNGNAIGETTIYCQTLDSNFKDSVQILIKLNYVAIPAKIEAEDYLAMSGIQTQETTDVGGGLNVGWIDAGDTLVYAIKVPVSGKYFIDFRVAALNANQQLSIKIGNQVIGNAEIPNTMGWQNWTNSGTMAELPQGDQIITIKAVTGAWNLNWFSINEYIALESISVSPKSALIKTGETLQLAASFLPENASNQSLIWNSSDTKVATISNLGLVTGLAVGSSFILVNSIDGNYLDTTFITVEKTTGNIEYPVSLNEFNIYPNPVNNNFTIVYNSENSDIISLSIYNVLGKCMLQEVFNNIVIGNTSLSIKLNEKFTDGVYFLKIRHQNRESVLKFLVKK